MSTIHSHKKIWVGLSKFYFIQKCMNWWMSNSLFTRLPYYRSHKPVFYSVFPSNCWFIWTQHYPFFNVVRMASSLSLTLFMSYPIGCAKDGEITNIRSSKCLPQSLLWQVGFHCTLFMFRSQSRKRVLFWGNLCIPHPLANPFTQLCAAQYTILHV